MAALLPVLLASSHLLLVADRVPQLNIEPSCAAAAHAAVSLNRTEDNCKQEEYTARTKLTQEWDKYGSKERAHCTELSTLGGLPSYVELLTCLEMEQATKNLPAANGKAGDLLMR